VERKTVPAIGKANAMIDDIRAAVPVVPLGSVACTVGGLRLTFVVVVLVPFPDRDDHVASATIIGLEDQAPAGYLKWHVEDDGEILDLQVREDRRRRGVGRLLWEVAAEVAADRGWPAPRHSGTRTVVGDAWAASVGGELPALTEMTDYEAFRSFPIGGEAG
jgi:GNAT superfamily N-acetyltransferase